MSDRVSKLLKHKRLKFGFRESSDRSIYRYTKFIRYRILWWTWSLLNKRLILIRAISHFYINYCEHLTVCKFVNLQYQIYRRNCKFYKFLRRCFLIELSLLILITDLFNDFNETASTKTAVGSRLPLFAFLIKKRKKCWLNTFFFNSNISPPPSFRSCNFFFQK